MKNNKVFLLLIPLFVITFATLAVLGYQWGLLGGLSATDIDLDPTDSSSIVAADGSIGSVDESSSSSNSSGNGDNSDETSGDSSSDSNDGTNSDSNSSLQYETTNDTGEFSVVSDNTFWQQNTSVDIFNGLEVVQPGSNGEFVYMLSNGKVADINYTMTINKSEDSAYQIPIVYRLKTLGGDYIGGEDWLSAEELEEITSVVVSGDQITYVLEWQWAFDTGSDEDNEYDTMLGQAEGLQYTLTITISAYADSDSVLTDIPNTGDNNAWTIYIAVFAISSLTVIFLAVTRKERKQTKAK
ncbi:MAG: hypothetical protein R3Y27_02770 [Clostridia bacterium]